MTFPPFAWPPLATPESILTNNFVEQLGPVLVQVASGAGPVQLIPAPPAGYLHVPVYLRGRNQAGAGTISYRVFDQSGAPSDTLLITNASAASVDIFLVGTLQSLVPVSTRIDLEVTGAGGPGLVYGYYARVPSTQIVRSKLVLTNAFQPLPNVVAPAGFALRPWPTAFNFLQATGFSVNADSATAQVEVRLTRGALVAIMGQSGAGILTTRSSLLTVTPPLILPGDVIEARTVAPPVIPGSVTLYTNWIAVPQL